MNFYEFNWIGAMCNYQELIRFRWRSASRCRYKNFYRSFYSYGILEFSEFFW